ncbi:MAG: (d)CMP kinase, partial [Rhizomicrobium sp.]
AVLDGRDIGTIVFPEAPIKFYIDARLEDRARRRHRELLGRGQESIYSRVLQDMKERDTRDRGRTVAPLIPAKDALVIDSSTLNADAVFRQAVAYIDRVLPNLAPK